MARSSSALRVVRDDEVKAQESDLREVETFAKGLDEKFLLCRELGHTWRPWTASKFRDGGYERVLRCSRCLTRRFQEISSRGEILHSHYKHPEGYLHKGMGRITGAGRGVLRLESIKRSVVATDAKAKKKE